MPKPDPVRARIAHAREAQHALCEADEQRDGDGGAEGVEGDEHAAEAVHEVMARRAQQGDSGGGGAQGDDLQARVEGGEVVRCGRDGHVRGVVFHQVDGPVVAEEGFAVVVVGVGTGEEEEGGAAREVFIRGRGIMGHGGGEQDGEHQEGKR